jgi:hypothetical protein
MPRPRNQVQRVLGILVLAIQKEENLVVGDSTHWPGAQLARDRAEHLLVAAVNPAKLDTLLGDHSVTTYIGADWLLKHPSVRPALVAVLKEFGRDKV